MKMKHYIVTIWFDFLNDSSDDTLLRIDAPNIPSVIKKIDEVMNEMKRDKTLYDAVFLEINENE